MHNDAAEVLAILAVVLPFLLLPGALVYFLLNGAPK